LVFEESLPYNVGRIADYAEYGELDDWREIEGIRRLWFWRVSIDRDNSPLKVTYAIFVGRYRLRKHIGSHAQDCALQCLGYHG
jgi:hypothetical protein